MKETEIKSTSRKAMRYRGVECLNCKHPLELSDRFCAYCGQINTTKRLTLKDFIAEFILSVFTYDSKFRFTIKDLLFKPGTITRNYVDGKRLKYANPFRFFLSASIFYFILLALFGLFEDPQATNLDNKASIINGGKEDVANIQKSIEEIDFGNVQNYNQEQADSLSNEIEEKINAGIVSITTKKAQRKNEEKKEFIFITEDSLTAAYKGSGSYLNILAHKAEYFYKFNKHTDISNPATALDSLRYPKTKTNIFLYTKTNDFQRVQENPVKFSKYLLSKTPFFLFFMAPFVALFFWLIYSKKKFNYMEHLVFIFHIFSWIFVVLIICLLPDLLLPGDNILAAILLILVGPFYFYKALRNFYKQKRRWTLIKFVFLNIVFFISTLFFALIFFTITALLF
ncbi:DUF3667 domain-containing protein [Dokdonia sp. Dokd-P16]|uniref:DUF3667 domain-containing protein n=1 Tax=Dokdonia sp. Dokd-P16 TaxID=2173169 RepID=UPI0013A553D6|nr:DUF3667 domain-containing protein [Dokdonia sp. Dokd-P16]